MSHTTDRRRSRAGGRRRPRTAWLVSVGAAVLVAAFVALDAADIVPGPLTTAPQIEVDALPRPGAVDPEAADAAEPLPADAPIPTGLAGIVEPVFEDAELSGRWSYDIRDALTGDVLLARDEATAHTPASVTKVLTGAAALGALGADTRFITRAVVDAPEADDLAAGSAPAPDADPAAGSAGRADAADPDEPVTVHLVGGGDVLLGPGANDADAVMGRAGLTTLATDTAAELVESGTTHVTVSADLSRYSGSGWHSGWERADIASGYITPIVPLMQESGYEEPDERYSARHEDPAAVATDVFAEALADAGAGIGLDVETEVVEPSAAPADARELAAVESAPVSQLVEFMLVHSDNVVAETLGREVALATDREATAAEAPSAVIDALASQDLDTGSIALEDASGLDYGNRISAGDLTTIIEASARAEGDLSMLVPAMPVAGFSGTLAPRYTNDESEAGAGVVHAKTGSLATVSSLAGTVVTTDDRLLVFSMMADEMDRGTSDEARLAFDAALARIAECGCA
ncbi:D-alanyl-D-alanine carboxypeptidase/D-alanyl-D-alanine endopeptidase [Brevibacterium jeotgali]|uniref:D-alanyl-D-alanine carboxypeptidase / D-alanyl-D-alanine-endopeptidase (Penicillin-binding protein 4) n=1 Tax=Brevibacterium jeotgali TaxID=1262550 RepID=A0A2H1L166_9MICO|nr:D-alanyl-D-alanine carboxypeptidase/D-alanyl-D-alanine-endopeptidase [Brevibacterium jeotgali]TWC02070.1 D-alanyl-D-alanine carboxypeptidase/D-alanyl-D-alanine-endopeptidase (penicillin-binding protein 4) [Brevibacterium jeotgali]SMY10579.1 D-alanyl-D-alanine carboxypeptidase / D-alanyl-D-alanine-endopeptidase (penicillin-binding protein 4) [Brevibacterium jeotgali]